MKKKWIKYLVGLLVTILALWLSFRKLDWVALKESFTHIDVMWAIASLISSLLAVYVMGWRWHILLKPKINLSPYYMFKLNIICQYLNIVIPARLGEFAKAWIPAKQHGISGSYVMGTVVIEKMFDLFSWAILWLTIPLFFAFHNNIETKGYRLILIAGIALIVLLVLVVWKKEVLRRWIHFFSGIIPTRFRQKVVNFLDRGMDAFGLLKNIRTTFILTLYTAAIFLLAGLCNFFLFKAFGFHLTLFEAVILLLIVEAGNAPPSVPGKIGIFEYMTILGLSLFGIGKSDALGYALVLHVISYLPKIILGFVYMANLNLSLKKAGTGFEELNVNDVEGNGNP
jgi:glycosyltransferase 2 family protein